MNRRYLLLGLATLSLIIIAAWAQKKPGEELLILEWAKKAKPETPPLAILIEMGTKDTEPTDWNGKATVQGAKVVHREGYRFRDGDKLIDPDGWQAKSRRPIRVPARQPAIARAEGIGPAGIVLHLADVAADATLTVSVGDKNGKLNLNDILSGEPKALMEGVIVRRVAATQQITTGKTEDDFPAAAYGPDGTLWVAYIAYQLKDESRRIQQSPLDKQPESFKYLYTPEFGDQLFVKYYKDGKWSEPIAVTGPNEDLVGCAVVARESGGIVVTYSIHRNGKFLIDSVHVDLTPGRPGSETRPLPELFDEPKPNRINPVSCAYSGSESVSVVQDVGLRNWTASVAVGLGGKSTTAYDKFVDGDYDVQVVESWRIKDIAKSSKFEARPSICYDAADRLWIAYEEGPEKWGKDYGPFDSKDGEPLYSSRSVRVVCLVDRKLMKPIAELPTSNGHKPMFDDGSPVQRQGQPGPNYERQSRYSNPRIGIDGKGRIWLTYRQKFGTRYSTHPGSYWITYARRLDGDKWTPPIEVHRSDGALDNRPVLLPHVSGGLTIIHNGDGRHSSPDKLQNHIFVSHIDLPGEPVEPKLVPHDPGKKNPQLVKEAEAERGAVKAIRDYRIDLGGKKYQLLRGEFHRHTELSWDGGPDGSLEDMFRYGIDAAAMDWIGNADHDNGGGREYSWWLTQKLTDAYHIKNAFTPMFTYERSVAYPHGHRNCMFAQRGVRTLPRLKAEQGQAVGGVHADDAKMLFRYLREFNGICASHTCATSMGTDWRDNDPVVEPIVEIYQGDRMSYEYEGSPRAGYDPQGNKKPAQIGGWQPLGFLPNAFKKGYKFGFQSSSDHWSTHISFCVAIAEKHDREGILNALKKRHCYGATDNIILDVRSGNHMMGDEFQTSEAPKLELTVIGTKDIAVIDILKDSEVVETIKVGKREHKGSWSDSKPAAGTHYYYVRVTQTDGELAWGSPMWIAHVK